MISGYRGYWVNEEEDDDLCDFSELYKQTPQKEKTCDHKWIETGFVLSKIVCKKCDKEKDN